jgi:Asp-tRNA(Asn)/Glu-tRNA(Gln) amidotransferase A subunit family amidase
LQEEFQTMLKPEDETRRLQLIVPVSWLEKINEWRRTQADFPNVSEAIRRLVEIGMEASRDPTFAGRPSREDLERIAKDAERMSERIDALVTQMQRHARGAHETVDREPKRRGRK